MQNRRARSRERIPTNILAGRFKESAGIGTSAPYQQRPVGYAYALIAKGWALGDLLLTFVREGKEHFPGAVAMHEARFNGVDGVSTLVVPSHEGGRHGLELRPKSFRLVGN